MARIGFLLTYLVEMYRNGLKRFMRVSIPEDSHFIVFGRVKSLDCGIMRRILRSQPLKISLKRPLTSGEDKLDI
jgi:hypothetical protein